MANTAVWFDIPVTDLERAMKFYSDVFQIELMPMEMGPDKMALFPFEEGDVAGSLVQSPNHSPSSTGTVVYLNGGEDLSVPLGRVASAGGKVLKEKYSIGEHGFIAFFHDTEGNQVGLHSRQ